MGRRMPPAPPQTRLARRGTLRRRRKWVLFHSDNRDEKGLAAPALDLQVELNSVSTIPQRPDNGSLVFRLSFGV